MTAAVVLSRSIGNPTSDILRELENRLVNLASGDSIDPKSWLDITPQMVLQSVLSIVKGMGNSTTTVLQELEDRLENLTSEDIRRLTEEEYPLARFLKETDDFEAPEGE